MPDMFRTRFKKEIVAEFLPPAHPARTKSSSFCAMACLRFLVSNRWRDFSLARAFGLFIHGIAEHGRAAGSFWRNRHVETCSTSATSCRLKLRKLHSVVASGWHRIKSLSLAEASAVRRQSCYRLIHELSGLSQTARLWTGAFWIRVRRRKLRKRTTPSISVKPLEMDTGFLMRIGRSFGAAPSTTRGTRKTKSILLRC